MTATARASLCLPTLQTSCACPGIEGPGGATRPGGLGAVFDWHVLENLDLKLPFMVSGGLNAENVAEAVRVTRAGGVDVSSGVERTPGVKDPEMIRAFIRAARATEELMVR